MTPSTSACPRRLPAHLNIFASALILVVPVRAQYEPSAPIAPHSTQECNAFATAMNQYHAAMRNAHEQCLATYNKTTKPLPEANNRICSQPACQFYHDFVYGARAAEGDRKVSVCFAEVNQYQARQAEEQRIREQQQREQAAQAEKRRQQLEAERAKRVAERAAWEAREEKRKQAEVQMKRDAEARVKTAKDEATRHQIEADRDREIAAIVQQRMNDVAPSVPPAIPPSAANLSPAIETNRDIPPQPPPPQLGREVLAEIKGTDPFGGTGKPAAISATSTDPSKWTDPFPSVGAKTPHSEEAFEKTTELAAKGAEKALTALDKDIDWARKAGNVKFVEAAEDTRSVLNGIGKMIKYADYAASAGKIINAETDQQRKDAIGDVGVKVASDVAKAGFEKYATTLFGEKIGAILLGPVAFVGSIGLDVLKSTPTARDPEEIIRDQSGASSLSEKREALYTMWKQYSRYGDQWQPVQKRQLLELTDTVYQELHRVGQ